MAETRVKVYQWQGEQERDEADAAASGWWVKRREPWENGTTRVTYVHGERGRRFGARELAVTMLVLLTLAYLLNVYGH